VSEAQELRPSYPLSPETKALLNKLIQERDEVIRQLPEVQRLDVALLATKAALGVPLTGRFAAWTKDL
jgi:hypothetical protein